MKVGVKLCEGSSKKDVKGDDFCIGREEEICLFYAPELVYDRLL